jgi:hypothetical protein
MAHEIAHVALRHGTNQASKAYIAQVPLSILGGALGGNSVGSVLAQLGIGFAANSILLKYSRDAERQADLLGTQILYDSGYDPRAMVEFFQKLEGRGGSDFFSSHPNPGNRIEGVNAELQKLGGAPPRVRNNSPDFREVKRTLVSAAAPPVTGTGDVRNARKPAAPSSRMVNYDAREFAFKHPDNWRVYGQGNALALAPDGGIVNGALGYGMMVAAFDPHYDREGRVSLEEATDQLLAELRQSNPNMRLPRNHDIIRVDGRRALLTEATNDSPVGGREVNWIVTVLGFDDALHYFVGVAPQGQFGRYERAFGQIIDSIRFG